MRALRGVWRGVVTLPPPRSPSHTSTIPGPSRVSSVAHVVLGPQSGSPPAAAIGQGTVEWDSATGLVRTSPHYPAPIALTTALAPVGACAPHPIHSFPHAPAHPHELQPPAPLIPRALSLNWRVLLCPRCLVLVGANVPACFWLLYLFRSCAAAAAAADMMMLLLLLMMMIMLTMMVMRCFACGAAVGLPPCPEPGCDWAHIRHDIYPRYSALPAEPNTIHACTPGPLH